MYRRVQSQQEFIFHFHQHSVIAHRCIVSYRNNWKNVTSCLPSIIANHSQWNKFVMASNAIQRNSAGGWSAILSKCFGNYPEIRLDSSISDLKQKEKMKLSFHSKHIMNKYNNNNNNHTVGIKDNYCTLKNNDILYDSKHTLDLLSSIDSSKYDLLNLYHHTAIPQDSDSYHQNFPSWDPWHNNYEIKNSVYTVEHLHLPISVFKRACSFETENGL